MGFRGLILTRVLRGGLWASGGLVVLLLGAPILFITYLIASDPGAAAEVLKSPGVWRVTLATIGLGLAVTASSVTLATVLALLIARTRVPGGRRWLVALALPLALPSFLVAEAFRRASVVGGERLLDGYLGAWAALTLITFPYAMLPLEASLRRSSRELELAARGLGYGSLATFFRVTLPQVRTTMEWSALLVFLYTISDFGAPVMLGVPVLTTAIYGRLSEFGMIGAAGLSMILAVIACACICGIAMLRNRDRGAVIADAHIEHRPEPRARFRTAGLLVCVLVFGASVGVPLAMVLGWMVPAWHRTAGQGRWIELLRYLGSGFGSPMWNALLVSAVSAVLAVVACVPLLVLSHRGQAMRGNSGADRYGRVALIGFAIPGVIVGFAFARLGWQMDSAIDALRGSGSAVRFFLYQSLGLLIAAYLVRCIAESLGPALGGLSRLPIERIDAAVGLGASRLRAWWRVGLPAALRPGLLAGAALSFLTVIKELPITLIARPTGFDTLATEMYANLDNSRHGEAAPYALAMVVLSMGLVAVLVGWQSGAD